ncbi:MAG TPA: hypothetical protein VF023_04485, partial [Bryobacteraceae bacterium]
MTERCKRLKAISFRNISILFGVLICVALPPTIGAGGRRNDNWLRGKIESGDHGLKGYRVGIYGSFIGREPRWELLGSDFSDSFGNFQIKYSIPREPANDQPVLFVEAERGPVMLTAAIGTGSNVPENVVVNERTTVASVNAFAQFIHGER